MAGASRLPDHFPEGTHYVVEGEPGKEGELLITARYLVLPNGTRVPVNIPRKRFAPAIAARRGRAKRDR